MSNDPWRDKLTPEQFRVLREKATEPAWSGELLGEHRAGTFVCGACGQQLFASGTKFDSQCGWPSFYDALPDRVRLAPDTSHGLARTEVTCANCDSHLGHLFTGEGFATPVDQRFCINSISLNFVPENNKT